MTNEERMDFIEFRMGLLYDNAPLSRYLYECEITKEQLDALYEIMDEIQNRIDQGGSVSSSMYEAKVLQIVDSRKHDYHFCELFAKLLWEAGSYEDVFKELYGQSQKYSYLFI